MLKFILPVLLFICSLQSHAQSIANTKMSSKEILKDVKKGKAVLVDVRTPEEFKAGHLKYAKNIDYKSENFSKEIVTLPKEKILYLYCRTGNRSGKSLDTLMQHGYTSVYNIGGLEDLKKEGLPAE